MPQLKYLKFVPEVCLLDVEHLHGPEKVHYGEKELIVLCLVKNGMPWIESFVEHYFSLGVKHIVFLENDSTDATVAAASRYDNVTVLRTKLRVNAYEGAAEVVMRQYLVARFARDRWSLCVDIDELFDYPYSDVIGLDALLAYLSSKSYTAVTAHALDMFPDKPLLERAGEEDHPLKEVHRFYDLSDLVRWNRQDRRPWRLDVYNNTLESDEVEWFAGGIRDKIFGYRPFLTNYPLVFYDGQTWPERPHYVYNANIADISCVLFHYKFVGQYRERTLVAARNWHDTVVSAEYAKSLEVLEENPNLQLKHETAREITSVNDLLENAFLTASQDYVDWVNTEERRSLLNSWPREPDALVESLLESRRRSRAKTLKLERTERRLLRSRRDEELSVRRLRELKSQLRDRDQKTRALERLLRGRDQRLVAARQHRRRLVRRRRRLRRRIAVLESRLESHRVPLKLTRILRSAGLRIARLLRAISSSCV